MRSADLGFPLVLKPVASTLGRFVRTVERPEDLAGAVAHLLRALPEAPDVRRCASFARTTGLDMGCDPFRQFLAESYAEGAPLETDGLVFGDPSAGGTVDLFGVTAQVVTGPPRFYIEGYLFPFDAGSRHDAISRAAIAALGMRETGFSIEFRGETLIEVNGRLGEDAGFPDLFEAALGKPPIRKWLEGDATPSVPRGTHAIAYRNHYAGGTVRSVDCPGGVAPLVAPGHRFEPLDSPAFYPHVACALASHPTDVALAYERARSAVDAVVLDVVEEPES